MSSKATHSLVLGFGAAAMLAALTGAASAGEGPEPYHAPDPRYAPMTKEPVLQKSGTTAAPELTDGKPVKGPAAGPEPYSAPDPR